MYAIDRALSFAIFGDVRRGEIASTVGNSLSLFQNWIEAWGGLDRNLDGSQRGKNMMDRVYFLRDIIISLAAHAFAGFTRLRFLSLHSRFFRALLFFLLAWWMILFAHAPTPNEYKDDIKISPLNNSSS